MLEFLNVRKSFWTGTRRKLILDDASFRVELGISLGILATNGTGKTTLINMMAGLEKPDEGRIIRGCNISFPLGFMGGTSPRHTAKENARPNTPKVNALKTSIRINKDLIEAKQAELTQTTGGSDSLASKNARMVVAEVDYQTREMIVQAAVQSVEAARVAADRQARYLATSVAPVRPEDPSYPRKFENTLLSFLIFGGVYLIMSLTASILREQV